MNNKICAFLECKFNFHWIASECSVREASENVLIFINKFWSMIRENMNEYCTKAWDMV